MNSDVGLILLTLAFFALSAVYARFCEKVRWSAEAKICGALYARQLCARSTAGIKPAPQFHRATHTMETLLISLIALGCLVYLVAAVLRPEKF